MHKAHETRIWRDTVAQSTSECKSGLRQECRRFRRLVVAVRSFPLYSSPWLTCLISQPLSFDPLSCCTGSFIWNAMIYTLSSASGLQSHSSTLRSIFLFSVPFVDSCLLSLKRLLKYLPILISSTYAWIRKPRVKKADFTLENTKSVINSHCEVSVNPPAQQYQKHRRFPRTGKSQQLWQVFNYELSSSALSLFVEHRRMTVGATMGLRRSFLIDYLKQGLISRLLFSQEEEPPTMEQQSSNLTLDSNVTQKILIKFQVWAYMRRSY